MRARAVVSGAASVVVCAGVVLVCGGAAPAAASAPETDLAFHGVARLEGGAVDLRLTPWNGGPAAVSDATVRLRWSVPLGAAQQLPARCVREDERTLLCGTGAVAVDAAGDLLRVPVRLAERSSEVTLEVETVWAGGAVGRDGSNDPLKVLVLDTGDAYSF